MLKEMTLETLMTIKKFVSGSLKSWAESVDTHVVDEVFRESYVVSVKKTETKYEYKYEMELKQSNQKMIAVSSGDVNECTQKFFGLIVAAYAITADESDPVEESLRDVVEIVLENTAWSKQDLVIPLANDTSLRYAFTDGSYQFMLAGKAICVSIGKDLEQVKKVLLAKLDLIIYGPGNVDEYTGLVNTMDELLKGGSDNE